MPWSEKQRIDIFEAAWKRETPDCPECSAPIVPNIAMRMGGNYILTASCPKGCGELEMRNDDDPRRGDFRAWTDNEESDILNAARADEDVNCPVDGAKLSVGRSESINREWLTILCHRCGQDIRQPED